MDCRREAARRGLVIRGPRKVFDSSVAHVGFLWAARAGRIRPYHDRVFARFWTRALDIEDRAAIARELAESGVETAGFAAFLDGEGRALHDRIRADAEARASSACRASGRRRLFWGNERIAQVRERLLGLRDGR